ncbi:MAG: rod-binding protein [Thermoguttaceae bacterium]|jgi:Rod binding domain-containing protein
MSIQAITPKCPPTASPAPSARAVYAKTQANQEKLQSAFQSVVGETLYGQVLKSMRKTVGKSKYFNGGRGEEVFQQQLDQVLAQKMSQASGKRLSQPMLDLFTLNRK